MFVGVICYTKMGVAAICYNHCLASAICYKLLNGLCYMLLETPWRAQSVAPLSLKPIPYSADRRAKPNDALNYFVTRLAWLHIHFTEIHIHEIFFFFFKFKFCYIVFPVFIISTPWTLTYLGAFHRGRYLKGRFCFILRLILMLNLSFMQ